MLIFGSTALDYWVGRGTLGRVPSDLDVLSSTTEKQLGVDVHWDEAFQYVVDNNNHPLYVDLDYLYTIKVSHCPWKGKNGKWIQHLKDIDIMKRCGARLDKHLHSILTSLWERKFGKKCASFSDKNNQTFFKDVITRRFDHDELHKLLAFREEPVHNLIRQDKDKPICSEVLFCGLSQEEKLLTVFEELYVIAAERWVFVDKQKQLPLSVAKSKALDLLITSLSKGWWNTYVIENAVTVMKKRKDLDKHFITKIKELL